MPQEISAGPGKVLIRFTPRLFSAYASPSERGVPSSPLLITPVRQKKYDMYASTIASIWNQAEINLAGANRIVIIGYSFPRTDTRALTLLKDALSQKPGEITVELVAPDATAIVGRLDKSVLGLAKSFIPRDATFDEYLEDMDTQIPSRMRKAASENVQVREWIDLMTGLSSATAEQRAALHRGNGGAVSDSEIDS